MSPASWENQAFILEGGFIIRPAALDCGEFMTAITVPVSIWGSSESMHTSAYPNCVVDTQLSHDRH